MRNRSNIERGVIQASENALFHKKYVSPLDVFLGMGLLSPTHVDDWKKGRVSFLEKVIQGNLVKISFAMKCFQKWAKEKNLKPSQTIYLAQTRGPKRELQFSKSGHVAIELAYRTHYISSLLSEQKQKKLKEKLDRPPELVVFITVNDTNCTQCKKDLFKGNFLFKENEKILCLKCASFDDLVFLESGDPKLTRRAKKYSSQCIVVVRFSRARKRYERQGILIESLALQKAQNECESE